MERRNVLDWVIRPALRTVPGVADVNALGGLVRSFEVTPDHAALSVRKITLQQLIDALKNNNRNDGAGRINRGEEILLVRAEGRIQTLDDVRSIIVASVNGLPISVADVAKVSIGALSRYGALSQDGEGEAVEGLVLSLRGANARQLVVDLEAKLEELKPALPEGLSVNVFYSRGDLVNRALSTVVQALLVAVVLVLALLVVFLGNLRASLTVACILPLSALCTFLLMQQFGLSANLTINPLEAVTTVTVQIVTLLTGDQEFDSPKTLAAFALALLLFVTTLLLNIIALRVVRKYREHYE